MIGKLLGFLFGKSPEIFDERGEVRHQLPDEKWRAWNDRYQKGEEYNWRNHTGTRAGERTESQRQNPPRSH